jgi:streptogramin lyase
LLYVSDPRHRRVVVLDGFGSGAPWQPLDLPPDIGVVQRPAGLATRADGAVALADVDAGNVVVKSPNGGPVVRLDPSGSPVGPLRQPTSVTFGPDGEVLIADQGNHRIVRASGVDAPTWSAFGDPGSSGPGTFIAPVGVHIDTAGRIFVADPGAGRLVRMDAFDGDGWVEISLPPADGPLRPYGLAAAGGGDGVLVTELRGSAVISVAADGTAAILVSGSTQGLLRAPIGVGVLDGELIVADAAANRLTRWVKDPASGAWTIAGIVLGDPGVANGPIWASIGGLALVETA